MTFQRHENHISFVEREPVAGGADGHGVAANFQQRRFAKHHQRLVAFYFDEVAGPAVLKNDIRLGTGQLQAGADKHGQHQFHRGELWHKMFKIIVRCKKMFHQLVFMLGCLSRHFFSRV